MIIDLIAMMTVGLIVELIAMLVVPQVIPKSKPMFVVSLVIIMLALTRWDWKGIITIPIMAVGAWLFGKLLGRHSEYYGYEYFLSILIGFLPSLIILIFNRKMKGGPFRDYIVGIGVTFLVLILVFLTEGITYALFTKSSLIGGVVFVMVQGLPGILITLLFMLVLRHQGMYVDVKKDLVSKAKEREMEKKYYSQYVNDVIIKNDKATADPEESDNSSK